MTAQTTAPALLTLDVEDWEHANYSQLDVSSVAAARKGRNYAMDQNTDRWIEICAGFQASSTCFVLGEFARRYPEAVKRLHSAGHEIASHCDTHALVYEMKQEEFRENLKRGLAAVGDLTGVAPLGFRAPSWSVSPTRTPWFIEELARAGLRYDSSEFPVWTPLFGRFGAPVVPYFEHGVLRVPVSVIQFLGMRMPFSSGAFFRLSPFWLLRAGFASVTARGLPPMIVLHPRELDPDHPRLPIAGWEGKVHYARMASVLPKLKALLALYPWTSIAKGMLDGSSISHGKS